MHEMRVAVHDGLLQAFVKLNRNGQKKAAEFISKFRNNPTAAGINYKSITGAANPYYRLVRIDDDFRGVVLKPQKNNLYVLLWVDKHDEAYEWARRVKVEVHPETGTLQVYETLHVDSPAADQDVPEASERAPDRMDQPAEPLFAELRERELKRLGIPEERLEMVQAISSKRALDAAHSKLPIEAYEALCFLADGVSKDDVLETYSQPDQPVDTEDYEAALHRDSSKRRFRVVEDEEELQLMLEAPLAKWRVFLHPEQRSLVERDWNGPVRVLGGAGTGKTVVAMHRAAWLVRNRLKSKERLLFTTFTRNLATDIAAHLKMICSPEELKQIDVVNIDAWLAQFLRRERFEVSIVYPGGKPYDSAWESALAVSDSGLGFPDSFYEEEWLQVILPQRIQSRQEYFSARRIGRGVALNRKQRAAIWPVFEEMRLQLNQAKAMTVADAAFAVMDLMEQGKLTRPYAAAVVDEAQDMGTETLSLIRAVVPEAKNDLMVVGDGHQRIYGRKAALSHSGINIRGRGKKLRVNYRTTEEIRRLATAVLEGIEFDDLDDQPDSTGGYRSLFFGAEPVLKGFDDANSEAAWIEQEVRALQDSGFAPSDICVIGRTKREFSKVKDALDSAGIENLEVSRDSGDDQRKPGVRLANMHRVKGLEFKIVFLAGVSDGRVPLELSFDKTEDPVEKRLKDLNERALLHVASSRAIHRLFVTWSGTPSRYIAGSANASRLQKA